MHSPQTLVETEGQAPQGPVTAPAPLPLDPKLAALMAHADRYAIHASNIEKVAGYRQLLVGALSREFLPQAVVIDNVEVDRFTLRVVRAFDAAVQAAYAEGLRPVVSAPPGTSPAAEQMKDAIALFRLELSELLKGQYAG